MFHLRFESTEIKNLADQYQPDEPEATIINDVVPNVRQQGYLTQADLVALCYWKSPRAHPRCAQNLADYIEVVTRTALTTTHERLRIEILMLLSGVGWPMASVILHWCHPDPYPILDFRALWSLSIETLPTYNFDFWWAYTQFCRNLAQQNNVSMRELDKALWQFSKMNQRAATDK
jgi:hypothetical protein